MRELLDTFPSACQSHKSSQLFNATNILDYRPNRRMCIQPCHGASNNFAKLLDNLVGGPNGRPRVLITSLYPPQRCDPKWAGGFEDGEEGLKSWVECEYASR